jgi:hypothetical protein
MLKLHKVEIKYTRGIAGIGPDLDLGGRSLILLGDNATGKSSYVDAIEYLLTRQCSSLDINKQGVSWRAGGVHIKADPKDLFIRAEFRDGAGPHYVDHDSDLDALASPIKEWIDVARQKCFLLRRRSLLRLIEAEPADRYAALAPFFSLETVVSFENKLRDSLGQLDALTRTSEDELETIENSFRREFGISEGVQITEIILWANLNARLKAVSIGPLKDIPEAQEHHAAVSLRLKTFSGIEEATKLQTVITAIASIGTLSVIQRNLESLAGLSSTLAELVQKVSRGFQPEVLEKGLQWVEASNDPSARYASRILPVWKGLPLVLKNGFWRIPPMSLRKSHLNLNAAFASMPSKNLGSPARGLKTLVKTNWGMKMRSSPTSWTSYGQSMGPLRPRPFPEQTFRPAWTNYLAWNLSKL